MTLVKKHANESRTEDLKKAGIKGGKEERSDRTCTRKTSPDQKKERGRRDGGERMTSLTLGFKKRQ